MPKNIVVFSDGTGQEGGVSHNTNVYKSFNMIEDRTPRQIAFYDPGLGTNWQKLGGKISGMGISKNIQQCYRFIFENFESRDRIFLIGFSRGAATMRTLSSFIHYFGILPKSRPDLIGQAYRIYKIRKEERRKKKAAEFVRRHHTMWTRIRFLGCYDTVAALGIPIKSLSVLLDGIPGFRHRFHNFTLSPSVENAFHALAIDDERKTFHPVLFNKKALDYQKIKQVWFSGMHTDVGGGYNEQELSDIALVWLLQMAVSEGLRIYPDHKVKIAENADGKMHNSREGFIGRLYRRKIRYWPEDRTDRPVVHQSVLSRFGNMRNNYTPWILKTDYDTETWIKFEDQKWFNDIE